MSKRFRPDLKSLQPLQSGPLGAYLESFAALLVQRGYCSECWYRPFLIVLNSSCRVTGCSDRWRLNTASADCRKATYTAKEGGTTSAALVQEHLPWKDGAIVLRSQCMLALRSDA